MQVMICRTTCPFVDSNVCVYVHVCVYNIELLVRHYCSHDSSSLSHGGVHVQVCVVVLNGDNNLISFSHPYKLHLQ